MVLLGIHLDTPDLYTMGIPFLFCIVHLKEKWISMAINKALCLFLTCHGFCSL